MIGDAINFFGFFLIFFLFFSILLHAIDEWQHFQRFDTASLKKIQS